MNTYATVVTFNRASEFQGSLQFGKSGLFYMAPRWRVDDDRNGPDGYEFFDYPVEHPRVSSALFRKQTAAIHVATWIPPSHNTGQPGEPRKPLENTRSYLLDGKCEDAPCPYLPSADSDDGFVLCKCLPCKLRDSLLRDLPDGNSDARWSPKDHSRKLRSNYSEIRRDLLTLSSLRMGALLDILFHCYDGGKANADTWEDTRKNAIKELAFILSVFREWKRPNFETESIWTAVCGDSVAIVLMDGRFHSQNCNDLTAEYWRAFKEEYNRPELRDRRILVVTLRSSGTFEGEVELLSLDIDEPRNLEDANVGQSIDEPRRAKIWACKASILEQAARANAVSDFLEQKLGVIHG